MYNRACGLLEIWLKKQSVKIVGIRLLERVNGGLITTRQEIWFSTDV